MSPLDPTRHEACHLRIRGRVQGVGYRASMAAEARRLGLRGWVRNRADGSVEAWACGDAGVLARLVQWAQRGPPLARVDRVDTTAAPADDALPPGFETRPTI